MGNGPEAAAAALAYVLQKKKTEKLVMDYTGRLSLMMQGGLNSVQPQGNTIWFDLANRTIPTGIFQLQHSPQLINVLFGCLQQLRALSGFVVSDQALQWAAEAGTSLCELGRFTFGALMQSITTQEMRSWFYDRCSNREELGQVWQLLQWTLGFPAVKAFCQGHRVKSKTSERIAPSGMLWFELLTEHFEYYEHKVLCTLLSSHASLLVENHHNNKGRNSGNKMLVVHAFPPIESLAGAFAWLTNSYETIHHLVVVKLFPAQQISPPVAELLDQANAIWITSVAKPLTCVHYDKWLTADEVTLVNNLRPGRMLLKDTADNAAIVIKSKTRGKLPHVHMLRGQHLPKGSLYRPVRLDHLGPPLSSPRFLYEQLCQESILRLAWQKVKQASKTSHGIDGVNIATYARELEPQLAALTAELRARTYRPRPFRRLQIGKESGGKRPISVACVRDRVVQAACLLLMEPLFDHDFSPFSFAFRPGRNAHQAVELAMGFFSDGYQWVVSADIEHCFDSIDQHHLFKILEQKVGDRELLELIRNWLAVDVIECQEVLPLLSGVPQGSSLSPLLANIYLDPLDRYLEQHNITFLRYADDIVLFHKQEHEAQEGLEHLDNFLRKKLHLTLKPAKTCLFHMDTGFSFLGFHLKNNAITIKRKKMDTIKSALEDTIRLLARHKSLEVVFRGMVQVNSLIRGLRNYFSVRECIRLNSQLLHLDALVTSLGHKYLPDPLQKESIWQLRERFFLPQSDSKGAPTTKTCKLAESGYPCADTTNKEVVAVETSSPLLTKKIETSTLSPPDVKGLYVTEDEQVHIFMHGCLLTADQWQIKLKRNKNILWKQRLDQCSALFVQGKGNSLTTSLHLALSDNNIPLFLLTSTGEVGVVTGGPIRTDKEHLRRRQAARREDPVIVRAGLDMLAAKIGNQAALLKYFSKYRKKTAPSIAELLVNTAGKIHAHAHTVNKLNPEVTMIQRSAMGIEGHAASLYWQAAASLVPESFSFTGRVTRNATDCINQCLNYSYALLYGEIWRALHGIGLDPCFGIIHGSLRDTGSMVYDLIEEFRVPFGDRLVLSLLGRGFIPATGKDHALLSKTRKSLLSGFYKRWHREMLWRSQRVSPAKMLHKQVKSLASLFLGTGTYKPYRMKW